MVKIKLAIFLMKEISQISFPFFFIKVRNAKTRIPITERQAPAFI